MFANLFRLITGQPAPEVDRHAFVQDVRVHRPVRPDPKVERFLLICWILIAVKHVFIIWACHHYPKIPFHQLWVNAPTWLLGALATGIYYGRLWRGQTD